MGDIDRRFFAPMEAIGALNDNVKKAGSAGQRNRGGQPWETRKGDFDRRFFAPMEAIGALNDNVRRGDEPWETRKGGIDRRFFA
ncbi:MAG: hypothetical protein ACRD50_16945, partial [Candidatus Acidiferrales bacterium]